LKLVGSNGLPRFASADDEQFAARYHAACHCGAVRYEVRSDPVDAKFCHCRDCQTLHGAPMQWAVIFHKHDVRFTAGVNRLRWYHSARRRFEHTLPGKVSCRSCGTPIADEGRNMWLAFPTLFDFGARHAVPQAFKPTWHIFYSRRVMDVNDGLPKWSGHKNGSVRLPD
jgi:hypothetical protein